MTRWITTLPETIVRILDGDDGTWYYLTLSLKFTCLFRRMSGLAVCYSFTGAFFLYMHVAGSAVSIAFAVALKLRSVGRIDVRRISLPLICRPWPRRGQTW